MSEISGISRRRFLATASGTALSINVMGCAHMKYEGKTEAPIAFVTANLVAQVSNWRFELANWEEQHKKTVAATDEAAWSNICRDIAACGYKAVEIWEAHAAPEVMDRQRAAAWKSIMDDYGLKAVGYGGTLSRKTAEICRWMGIPQINGWVGENTPEQAAALCRETGVRFNIENHPQKTAPELLKYVGGGNDWLGVCIDMGWLGTQGVNGPDFIRECGKLVRNTHVKDVKAIGGHETCLLGEGVAGVAACIAALKEIGYSGWYAWEDEPEDRNPFDSAVRNRRWIEKQIG